MSATIVIAVQSLVAALLGAVVLLAYRWVRQRSSAAANILALGILVRVALGVSLFWVSHLRLPFGRALQASAGFWQFAIDATGYHVAGAGVAATHTFVPLDHVVPGPFYVNVLGIMMMAVGQSPPAGMLLNLLLYVAVAVLIVWSFRPVNQWRADLPALAAFAAYSFLPVIVLHSTQPLKDELASLCVVVACVGVIGLRALTRGAGTGGLRTAVAGGAVVALMVFASAGMRWYYALIMMAALGVSFVVLAFVGRTTPLLRFAGGAAAILMAGWLGYWGGSGPHYRLIAASLERASLGVLPSELSNMVMMTRTGFLTNGGTTNVVVALRDDGRVGEARYKQMRDEQRTTAAYQERVAEQRIIIEEQQRQARLERERIEREERARAEAERLRALEERRRQEAEDARIAELERVRATRAEAARLREAREALRRAALEAAASVASNEAAGDAAAGDSALEAAASVASNEAAGDAAAGDSPPAAVTETAQTATARTAGRTPAAVKPPPPPPPARTPEQIRKDREEDLAASRGIPIGVVEQVKVAAVGLGLLFIPSPVLDAAFGIEVPGGRAVRTLVDLDTVVLDISLVVILGLLWTRRSLIGGRLQVVVFGLALGVIAALLLGYVVTNFGTLWRLRPLVAVPLWMTVLALVPAQRDSSDVNRSGQPLP